MIQTPASWQTHRWRSSRWRPVDATDSAWSTLSRRCARRRSQSKVTSWQWLPPTVNPFIQLMSTPSSRSQASLRVMIYGGLIEIRSLRGPRVKAFECQWKGNLPHMAPEDKANLISVQSDLSWIYCRHLLHDLRQDSKSDKNESQSHFPIN